MDVRRKDKDQFAVRSLKLATAARKPWSRVFYESVGNATIYEFINQSCLQTTKQFSACTDFDGKLLQISGLDSYTPQE